VESSGVEEGRKKMIPNSGNYQNHKGENRLRDKRQVERISKRKERKKKDTSRIIKRQPSAAESSLLTLATRE